MRLSVFLPVALASAASAAMFELSNVDFPELRGMLARHYNPPRENPETAADVDVRNSITNGDAEQLATAYSCSVCLDVLRYIKVDVLPCGHQVHIDCFRRSNYYCLRCGVQFPLHDGTRYIRTVSGYRFWAGYVFQGFLRYFERTGMFPTAPPERPLREVEVELIYQLLELYQFVVQQIAEALLDCARGSLFDRLKQLWGDGKAIPRAICDISPADADLFRNAYDEDYETIPELSAIRAEYVYLIGETSYRPNRNLPVLARSISFPTAGRELKDNLANTYYLSLHVVGDSYLHQYTRSYNDHVAQVALDPDELFDLPATAPRWLYELDFATRNSNLELLDTAIEAQEWIRRIGVTCNIARLLMQSIIKFRSQTMLDFDNDCFIVLNELRLAE